MKLDLIEQYIIDAQRMGELAEYLDRVAHGHIGTEGASLTTCAIQHTNSKLEAALDSMALRMDPAEADKNLIEATHMAKLAVHQGDRAHNELTTYETGLAGYTIEQTVILIKRAREAIVRQEDLLEMA